MVTKKLFPNFTEEKEIETRFSGLSSLVGLWYAAARVEWVTAAAAAGMEGGTFSYVVHHSIVYDIPMRLHWYFAGARGCLCVCVWV